MEARAKARYVRVTPRKARRVVDMIRGMPAEEAQAVLSFAPQAASAPVRKVLLSAVALRRTGFYAFVAVYAVQRFAWEFWKPYATIIGPLNLFHLLSLALVAYALVFARRELQQCRYPQPLST